MNVAGGWQEGACGDVELGVLLFAGENGRNDDSDCVQEKLRGGNEKSALADAEGVCVMKRSNRT